MILFTLGVKSTCESIKSLASDPEASLNSSMSLSSASTSEIPPTAPVAQPESSPLPENPEALRVLNGIRSASPCIVEGVVEGEMPSVADGTNVAATPERMALVISTFLDGIRDLGLEINNKTKLLNFVDATIPQDLQNLLDRENIMIETEFHHSLGSFFGPNTDRIKQALSEKLSKTDTVFSFIGGEDGLTNSVADRALRQSIMQATTFICRTNLAANVRRSSCLTPSTCL